MKFKLIKEKNPNPKCPNCMRGYLVYYKPKKEWICCKDGGGWMWCGRRYKGKKGS